MRQLQRTRGVTLLEVLLVLAVASSVILLALQTYRTMSQVTDQQQLLMNVDAIFAAAALYYYYECNSTTTTDSLGPNNNPGIINPVGNPSVLTAPTLIDMTDVSIFPINFLNLALIKPTSLVTNGGGTNMNGYYAQFNPIATSSVKLAACTSATNCTTTSSTTSSGATVVNFVIQVGVQLASSLTSSQMSAYANELGADCLSSVEGSGVVYPCSANKGGSILVFTRLPSRANPNASSPIWQTLPLVKQFNIQYAHDQNFELNNSSTTNYYLCGS